LVLKRNLQKVNAINDLIVEWLSKKVLYVRFDKSTKLGTMFAGLILLHIRYGAMHYSYQCYHTQTT